MLWWIKVIRMGILVLDLRGRVFSLLPLSMMFSSVRLLSPVWLLVIPWNAAHRLPCPSLTFGACSNSCPLSQWCHPTISYSVVCFTFCSQSFPAPGSFAVVSFSHQVAKVLELQLQHQFFQWIFRTDFLYDWLVWSPCSLRDSQESSPTPQFKSINSLALNFLYSPALTSIHDYWKNHGSDYMVLCWQSKVSPF